MKEFTFNPIRRILVPTDFSPNASGALHYAAALAVRLRSRLILFHSTHIPVVAGSAGLAVAATETDSPGVHQRLEELRLAVLQEFPTLDAEVSTAVGFAVDEIICLCASRKADLIVMGTKGAHGAAEMLIGSNTAEVIAKASCPVLAVPERAGVKEIRKIVFATNYSDNDFQSLFLLTEIFKPWNAEIIVVHADDTGQQVEENQHFEWFKSQVMTSISYDKFFFNLVSGKNTEQAVSDFVRSADADILSVSTRRRSLFERLTSRSMTRKFAYHTHIPLLAFHAGAAGSSL